MQIDQNIIKITLCWKFCIFLHIVYNFQFLNVKCVKIRNIVMTITVTRSESATCLQVIYNRRIEGGNIMQKRSSIVSILAFRVQLCAVCKLL